MKHRRTSDFENALRVLEVTSQLKAATRNEMMEQGKVNRYVVNRLVDTMVKADRPLMRIVKNRYNGAIFELTIHGVETMNWLKKLEGRLWTRVVKE